jgi:hypothetical protein
MVGEEVCGAKSGEQLELYKNGWTVRSSRESGRSAGDRVAISGLIILIAWCPFRVVRPHTQRRSLHRM